VAVWLLVERQVKDGLRSSLLQTHEFVARARANYEVQNSRLMAVVAESPTLKAGMELVRSEPGNEAARRTVEDQLAEMAATLGFDLMLAIDEAGRLQAGVAGMPGKLSALKEKLSFPAGGSGLIEIQGVTYNVNTVPVNLGPENLGSLGVGKVFDFAEFSAPTVLLKDRRVLRTNLAGADLGGLEKALERCSGERECELAIQGESYLSLPMESLKLGDGYLLRSLQSVDAAAEPLRGVVGKVCGVAASVALAAMMLLSMWSARSVVKPVTGLIERLRETERTGELDVVDTRSHTREIRQLAEAFNRAAAAIREAHNRLRRAHVEFIESMASALDARDVYTAGHSRRVADYSCALAQAAGLPPSEAEAIRVGALLHDIGKIGVPDAVLLKPGKLTEEEYDLIRRHPEIGRQILANVTGFQPYLDIVELHHENHDGSGYPHGRRSEEVPLPARIVHVADAYDAMTSDRPYRPGMTHEQAIRILQANRGTQFEPRLVDLFAALHGAGLPENRGTGVGRLLDAVAEAEPAADQSATTRARVVA
jgi:putative nucleotidyltransferase with HDIG domain